MAAAFLGPGCPRDIAPQEGTCIRALSAMVATVDTSQYPVPVTPLVGGKDVELERAKIAESAMKSGAAITLQDVLFQDEWLLVVNKPAGVYSEHVLVSVPTLLGHPYCSKYPIEDVDGVLPHLHLGNRLDRDTSGLLIVTISKEAAGKLTKQFGSGGVKKSYLARCSGVLPSWKSATLVSGHGRSRHGCWRVYSEKDIGRPLPKGVVKKMVTRLDVLGFMDDSSSFAASSSVGDELLLAGNKKTDEVQAGPATEVLVRAFPETGRTHQIRMHCQYLGLPLRGDVKYGGPHVWKDEVCSGHLLHAESIRFKHPVTEQELHLVAPQPSWARCLS